MKYTNRYNLPTAVDRWLRADDYDYEASGDASITGLIKSPRQRLLELRHDDDITVDISDRVWLAMGTAVHRAIHLAAPKNSLAEERLELRVNGWKVTGQVDLFEGSVVTDYKVTSLNAIKETKREWVQQTNSYNYLVYKYGFKTTRLDVVAILRDWHLSGKVKEDYPPAGIVVREMPMWTPGEASKFLLERVKAHQEATELNDLDLPECTFEERWGKSEKWAVKKRGGQRAWRLFDTEEEANGVAKEMSKGKTVYDVEYRPAKYPKCNDYCLAAPFCNQVG